MTDVKFWPLTFLTPTLIDVQLLMAILLNN